MLTRIRFEAEGATPGDCRRDLYAAAERLLSAALARIYDEPESDADFSVRMSSWVHEEVYSALSWTERVPDAGQLYKGRLVIGLPVAPPEQTFTDAVFRYGHDAELAAAAEDTSPEECDHPRDAIFYNPDNGVFQCHRCGTIFDVKEADRLGDLRWAVRVDYCSPEIRFVDEMGDTIRVERGTEEHAEMFADLLGVTWTNAGAGVVDAIDPGKPSHGRKTR